LSPAAGPPRLTHGAAVARMSQNLARPVRLDAEASVVPESL